MSHIAFCFVLFLYPIQPLGKQFKFHLRLLGGLNMIRIWNQKMLRIVDISTKHIFFIPIIKEKIHSLSLIKIIFLQDPQVLVESRKMKFNKNWFWNFSQVYLKSLKCTNQNLPYIHDFSTSMHASNGIKKKCREKIYIIPWKFRSREAKEFFCKDLFCLYRGGSQHFLDDPSVFLHSLRNSFYESMTRRY